MDGKPHSQESDDVIARKLFLHGLGAPEQALIRSFTGRIREWLPQVLEAFYEFATTTPETRDFFRGQDLDRLKKAQTDHWVRLFSCDFSATFFNSCLEIGRVHARAGISPDLYVASYNFVLRQLTRHLAAGNFRSSKVLPLIMAVESLVMLDMDLVLSSFLDKASTQMISDANNNFADSLMDRSVDLSMATCDVVYSDARMMVALEEVDSKAREVSSGMNNLAGELEFLESESRQAASLSRENREGMVDARQVMDRAMASMDQVAEAVAGAVSRISTLTDAAGRISGMVQSIEDIASQTNLLALNATIEAARAGEAGRGFAVVAGEVKSLSAQTARATEDIRTRMSSFEEEIQAIVRSMDASHKAVGDGQERIRATGEKLNSIAGKVEESSLAMETISGTLASQMEAARGVASECADIATSTSRNVATVGDSITALRNVEQLISGLVEELAQYDIPHRIVRIAKKDHLVWKKNIAEVFAGTSEMNSKELSDHTACRLGKWYYSDKAAAYKGTPEWQALEAPHKAVHGNGIRAMQLFEAGERDKALAALEEVEVASRDVIRLLDQLASGPVRAVRDSAAGHPGNREHRLAA